MFGMLGRRLTASLRFLPWKPEAVEDGEEFGIELRADEHGGTGVYASWQGRRPEPGLAREGTEWRTNHCSSAVLTARLCHVTMPTQLPKVPLLTVGLPFGLPAATAATHEPQIPCRATSCDTKRIPSQVIT